MTRGPGDEGRDEGMGRAEKHAGLWSVHAHQLMTAICERWPGNERTGEAIGDYIVEKLGPPPNHNNAIGSLIGWGVMKGYLVETDKPRVKLQKPTSHSRKTPIYRLVHPRDAISIPRTRRRDRGDQS